MLAKQISLKRRRRNPSKMRLQWLTFVSSSLASLIRCLLPDPADGLARQVNPDALDLRVHLKGVLAHLATVARLFVAAEGRGRVHHVEGVDPDDARLYLAGEAVCARDVARPDACGESVGDFVRLTDEVALVLEGDDGDDGAEYLLLRDAHLVAHLAEDGRLEEVASLQVAFERGRAAAAQHGRTFVARDVNVRLDAVQLLLRNLRPHLRRLVRRVADLYLLRLLSEATEELVFDSLIKEEARACATDLPLVEEDAHHRAVDGLLHVGVGEDDVRRFASEFERDFRKVLGSSLRDELADFRAAREGDLVNSLVRGERRARSLAVARHDVDDAVGEARFLNQLSEFERRDRRLLCGLQHYRIARGERGREFPSSHQQRKVPGYYLTADAHRFA